jgi:putative flavoprotein involved in K+ transport
MPRTTEAIIIGAGQAGLAMSHCLAGHGLEHVLLERGRTAERWRSERWASLRLLTPNWMSRLPGGWSYQGPDPDGFMTMPEVIEHLEGYARSFAAPVETGTTVQAVRPVAGGYAVETDRGAWRARAVVIATGHCGLPAVPAMARDLPEHLHQITPSEYREPGQLPEGGVLVVGASASGVQLAEEIHRSGRHVTLAVGRHTRLPRRWRGRDIMAWMDRIGVLDESAEQVRNLAQARAQPSLQLVGRPDGRSLDLGVLHRMGVRVLGRLAGVSASTAHLAGDLAETTAASQRTLGRLLARIGPVANALGAPPEDPPPAPDLPLETPARLDLAAEGIRTVLWATGFRRDYGWLRVPGTLDHQGEIIHQGGVTSAPGLYVLGLRFMRRRRSSFLDGVGVDAEALAWHLLGHSFASGPARRAAA